MPDRGRSIINTARIYLLDSELLDSSNIRHRRRLEISQGNGIIELVVYDHRRRRMRFRRSSDFNVIGNEGNSMDRGTLRR